MFTSPERLLRYLAFFFNGSRHGMSKHAIIVAIWDERKNKSGGKKKYSIVLLLSYEIFVCQEVVPW